VDDGLPHQGFNGDRGPLRAKGAGLDECTQEVDRRNADNRHRQFDLQDTGIDVSQPFRLVRVVINAEDLRS
jgi:hypothetical protein